MNEETAFAAKPKKGRKAIEGESSIWGCSLRGWLAVMVLSTLCFIEVLVCYACLKRHVEYVPSMLLHDVAIMIVTFYYAKKVEPTPPTSSSSSTTTVSETKPPPP